MTIAGLACGVMLATPAAASAAGFWPLASSSPQVRSGATLFWIVVGIAFVFLAAVWGGLLYVIVRFRGGRGVPDPHQKYLNRRLEFWWTAVPVLVLIAVFVLTVLAANAELVDPPDPLHITIIGHQWWWELRYPALGAIAANEIHVPTGQPVELRLQSADVIHNFWIPALAGKEQLIPGRVNRWGFTADAAGIYDGECSEFCGAGHAWMRLRLVAESPAAFQTWASAQAQPADLAAAPNSQQALRTFTEDACSQCHTIRGTAAAGTVGPDLTHLGSRGTLAAGRLPNTQADLTHWLLDPQRFKPGSYMPNLHLSQQDAAALASFLEGLK